MSLYSLRAANGGVPRTLDLGDSRRLAVVSADSDY